MSWKTHNRTLISSKRGVSLVEMVFVTGLLLLLVFGMIDFGFMLREQHALNQIAREAARSAAVGRPDDDVKNEITQWGVDLGIKGKIGSTIDPPDTDRGQGDEVTVTLSYTHSGVAGGLGFGDRGLTATMVMRQE